MNNNDIFKKLRVALQLRDDQIVEIMQLVDFRISKSEIGAFFRNADHPKYMDCGDQVLRNFLDGLVIHLRGTKDAPKDPNAVLAENKAAVQSGSNKLVEKKPAKDTGKGAVTKTNPKKPAMRKPAKQQPVVGKVKYKNGKNKKSDKS